ncbi:hypothetical protein THIOKS1670021 [Thiocapsa sp. KS1]|nr:hypothetical protein THIOKS1670021 [Thiocapsa sp. KS1]
MARARQPANVEPLGQGGRVADVHRDYLILMPVWRSMLARQGARCRIALAMQRNQGAGRALARTDMATRGAQHLPRPWL